MNWKDLIGVVPDILLFVIPGYITIRISERFKSEKHKDSFDTILYSVLYSFFIGIIFSIMSIAVESVVPAYKDLGEDIADIIRRVVCLVLSVCLAYMIIKLPETKIGKKVYKAFNENLEPYPNVWSKAMNNPNGAWVTVYLKNGLLYTGILSDYTSDPNEKIQEIMLTNFRLSIKSDKPISDSKEFSLLIDDNTEDDFSKVLLDRSNILSIEVFQTPPSSEQ